MLPVKLLQLSSTDKSHEYLIRYYERGARFECNCGEVFREYTHAIDCKKCRKYLYEPPKYVSLLVYYP